MIANWVILPCLLSQCSSQQATETGWKSPASLLTLEKTSCLVVSSSPWPALVCSYITQSPSLYTLWNLLMYPSVFSSCTGSLCIRESWIQYHPVSNSSSGNAVFKLWHPHRQVLLPKTEGRLKGMVLCGRSTAHIRLFNQGCVGGESKTYFMESYLCRSKEIKMLVVQGHEDRK